MTMQPPYGSFSNSRQRLEPLKVAVLMGGISREREVSIESGRCVADALREAGLNVITSDIKPDELSILDDKTIDVFFIALHGTFGEDGTLQEILESKGLVYTGSGPQASRLAFDKWASKKRFIEAGLPTPEAILYEPGEKSDEIEQQIRKMGERYVIKPLREGSTFGISIADDPKSAVETAEKCAQEFGECMIERFIKGRELTVGILDKEALPIIEIRPRAGFYDYHAKYIDNGTEYLFDTIRNSALIADIQKMGTDCFNAIACRGAARVDLILDDEDKPYVLEINTIPGMTSHSLLPKAAAKAGISMSGLCMKIIESALADMRTPKTESKRC